MSDLSGIQLGGIGGKTQNLDDGLNYDADGKPAVPDIENPDDVLQVQEIGAYRRVVYTDGSVAVTQVKPNVAVGVLETPIPLPGDEPDAKVKTTSKSSK